MTIKLNENNIYKIKVKLENKIADLEKENKLYSQPSYGNYEENNPMVKKTQLQVALDRLKENNMEIAEYIINEFKLVDND